MTRIITLLLSALVASTTIAALASPTTLEAAGIDELKKHGIAATDQEAPTFRVHEVVAEIAELKKHSVAVPNQDAPTFKVHELYHLTTQFLDSFMYPANIAQAASINSTFFAPNILGRVDATRTFDGPELNTEYLYGLFSGIPITSSNKTSTFFTLLGVPLHYSIAHFSATQNIVSVSIINIFNVTSIGALLPLEVDLWLTFNSDRKISQYDASFRYLAWEFATVFAAGQAAFHVDAPTLQFLCTQKIAASICGIAQTSCMGPNKQYESHDACMDFLTKGIRFGQAFEMGMNTLLCRMVHQGMVPLRPDVHCSHIGPSGGAYCKDDRTYADTVTQKYFANAPFVPYGLH